MFRVTELQSKLDDVTAERRSLADSASSPVDDELHNISDTSFSSDRPPAFRPPLPPPRPPPPFFGYRHSPRFIPPFYGIRPPPPPDRLHSPPAFDAYHGDPYVRESPRPRDTSPPAGRRPLPPEHHRSAPPFDSSHEESYMGRSPPPPRGNSPPYYDERVDGRPRSPPPPARGNSPPYDKRVGGRRRSPPPPARGNSPPYYDERFDGRRSPPTFDGSRSSEQYGRRSPRAGENSAQRRDQYYRQDRPRTPDEESFNVPPGGSRGRSRPVPGEERYQQSHPSHYSSHRNVVDPDTRPTNVRSPPQSSHSPADNDDYPTYWYQARWALLLFIWSLTPLTWLIE